MLSTWASSSAACVAGIALSGTWSTGTEFGGAPEHRRARPSPTSPAPPLGAARVATESGGRGVCVKGAGAESGDGPSSQESSEPESSWRPAIAASMAWSATIAVWRWALKGTERSEGWR